MIPLSIIAGGLRRAARQGLAVALLCAGFLVPALGQAFTLTVLGPGGVTAFPSPAGHSCSTASGTNVCSYTYPAGTQVLLTALPNASAALDQWTGACTGNQAQCVVPDSAGPITATFTSTPLLTTTVVGSGSVTSSPGLIICTASVFSPFCSSSFAVGSNVVLTATPGAGSSFAGWSGACNGMALTCSVAMTSRMNVTATFALPSLTVIPVGSGAIVSSPTGINCPTTCAQSFASGTSLTLTATANIGYLFTGWSGAGCTGQGATCTITPTASATVWANFVPAPPPPGIAASPPIVTTWSVAAGGSHACALTAGGGVQCWGDNSKGGLGIGTIVSSSSPVNVSGIASGAVAVATGFQHSCALMAAGSVQCWGMNGNGQLGNGGSGFSMVPVTVNLPLGVTATAISTGANHTCALTSGGAVYCWGVGDRGEIGNGTASPINKTPAVVSGLTSGVVVVASGAFHNCAILATGAVTCWGENARGQLGDGTLTFRTIPTTLPVPGVSGATALALGAYHSCALNGSGGVQCWGDNARGELGNGLTSGAPSLVAVSVTGLTSGVAAIAAGDLSSCAITSGGAALCWGANGFGQLGNGSTIDASVPTGVTGLPSSVAALSVGVSGLASGFYSAAGQLTTSCAVLMNGAVECWGAGASGALGNGGVADAHVPTVLDDAHSLLLSKVHAADTMSCADTLANNISCWGSNAAGQLGNANGPGEEDFPSYVPNYPDKVHFGAVGYSRGCAIGQQSTTFPSGFAYCWGSNPGYAGSSGFLSAPYPQLAKYLFPSSGVVIPWQIDGMPMGRAADGVIAVGADHTCVLEAQGVPLYALPPVVSCWALDNSRGQVGNGTFSVGDTVGVTTGLAPGSVQALAAGNNFTCALTFGGAVWCWGADDQSQLGDNPPTSFPYADKNVPVQPIGLSGNVIAITAGDAHACALLSEPGGNTVQCWGSNIASQVGDFLATSSGPVTVNGLPSNVIAISAGGDHTCALDASDSVWCWGDGNTATSGASNYLPPVAQVLGLASGVTSISSGFFHSCALLASGVAQCWGDNSNGQLGNGSHQAVSAPQMVGLTVPSIRVSIIGSGGTVAASPAGISCGINCYVYPLGTVVTLAATTPGAGVSWGGACTGAGACKVTVSGPTEVSASVVQPALAVNIVGTGSLNVCALGSCTLSYAPGQVVTLQPVAGSGTFLGWSGACGGTGACSVTMNADQGVTATFAATAAPPWTLTVQMSGNGQIVSNPAGLSCSAGAPTFTCYGSNCSPNKVNATCGATFPADVAVTLTATAGSGSQLTSWFAYNASVGPAGTCSGTTNPCVLASPTPVALSATFTPLALTTVQVSGAGTVTSNPVGISCVAGAAAGCTLAPSTASVTLTATPAGGTAFAGWSGGQCSGASPTCVLPANFTGQVNATFGSVCLIPGLADGSTGTAVIDSNLGGLPLCDLTGQTINLHAEPSPGSVVTAWASDGPCANQGSVCILPWPSSTQTIAAIVHAGYEISSVNLGRGSGTVGSTIGGIACGTGGTSCTASSLPYNVQVTLTASPDPGTIFSGWQGACTGIGECLVTSSDSPQAVSATFYAPLLSVAAPLGGQVVSTPAGISCAGLSSTADTGTCSSTFKGAASLTLTAAPSTGFSFGSWGGACAGQTGATCTLAALSADAAVSVNFVPTATTSSALLSLVTVGSGTITSNPAGINCPLAGCAAAFVTGTSVTLTATPDAGYAFSGWTGACTGSGTCQVLLNAASSVTATFSPAVSVQVQGQGSIASVPAGISCGASCSSVFVSGSGVTLSATPASGQLFTGWLGGGCAGTGTCVLTAGNPVSVIASFAPIAQRALLAAGDFHSCAVAAGGAVACWGNDTSGELALGATTLATASSPTASAIASGTIQSLAAGGTHTCAVTATGGAECWGLNANGQLGNGLSGAGAFEAVPQAVVGLSTGVLAVSGGYLHSCALLSSGAVMCWGDNSYGQLGIGTNGGSAVPAAVQGLTSPVVAISSGDYHTCALTTAGQVQCWGDNNALQLGTGAPLNGTSTLPVTVTGLSGTIVAISAGGYHNCALNTLGVIQCWGINTDGELGSGVAGIALATPVTATLPAGVTAYAISGRGYHSCALTSAGAAYCWGQDLYGELGAGVALANSPAPIVVSGLGAGVANIVAGYYHSCAVLTSGNVDCWGQGSSGQLGNNLNLNQLAPVAVVGVGGVGANLNLGATLLQAPQIIHFAVIASRSLGGAAFTPIVNATSGLAVTLTSSTPAVCTVTGLAITTLAAGSCTVVASQPGDATHAPAVPVTRTFTVSLTGVAYVTNYASNTVTAYRISSGTGALTAVPGSPFNVGAAPTGIAVHPNLRFAYVVNALAPTGISTFAINPATGALTPSGSQVPVTGDGNDAVIDPSGRFLFMANFSASNVSVFTINATTGALTAVAGSPFAVGAAPWTSTVDPSGRFLYVPNSGSGTVSAFTINPDTGVLTAVAGSPFAAATFPQGVVADPSGQFLYVSNSGSNTISEYAINATSGALTALGAVATGVSPYSMTIVGSFLYVDHNGATGNDILSFSIGTTGLLTVTANAPALTGLQSWWVAPDSTGRFVYACNAGAASLSAFSIAPATGALSTIAGSPYPVGLSPEKLKVAPVITAVLGSSADIAALAPSSGSLGSQFLSATTSYTDVVSNQTVSLLLTVTLADPSATLAVTGNGLPVALAGGLYQIPLNVGANAISLKVLAQDGVTTKSYTLTVTRAGAVSSIADLAQLGLASTTSPGVPALSPTFSSAALSYTDAVVNAVSAITVTPVLADTTATLTVTVNGVIVAGGGSSTQYPATLNVGSNVIQVTVLAQDKLTTKKYTVTVTRAAAPVVVTTTPGGSGDIPLPPWALVALGLLLSALLLAAGAARSAPGLGRRR